MHEQSTPPGFPPMRQMSRESFEALLLEVVNGSSVSLAKLAGESIREGEPHEAVIADQRAVWHAAEVALGVLTPGYRPKREALEDIRRLLAWTDSDDRTWLGVD
jgi:hypothetical protein